MTAPAKVGILFLVAARLLLPTPPASRRVVARALDLCSAVAAPSHSNVTVRGLGSMTPDGFSLFDRTCPAAVNGKNELPSIILIRALTFREKSDEQVLQNAHLSKAGMSDLYQIAVRGDVTCQADFRFRASDDGDIVGGNGFGTFGLAKCSMKNGLVVRVRPLD